MSEIIQEAAQEIASAVLHHIDTMYPGMWRDVPRNARISVRNTIINEVKARFHETGEGEVLQ